MENQKYIYRNIQKCIEKYIYFSAYYYTSSKLDNIFLVFMMSYLKPHRNLTKKTIEQTLKNILSKSYKYNKDENYPIRIRQVGGFNIGSIIQKIKNSQITKQIIEKTKKLKDDPNVKKAIEQGKIAGKDIGKDIAKNIMEKITQKVKEKTGITLKI